MIPTIYNHSAVVSAEIDPDTLYLSTWDPTLVVSTRDEVDLFNGLSLMYGREIRVVFIDDFLKSLGNASVSVALFNTYSTHPKLELLVWKIRPELSHSVRY